MLKEQVLQELAAARGKSLSGQELARTFAVSRTAVWKAIRQLESEGIAIQAEAGKGYRLAPYALTPFDLQLPQGVQTFFYGSIDSTNSQAKRLLAEGLQAEAVIVADEQTAGRGRCGRSFYSPKHTGVYFSYIFHPEKTLADAVLITTAAAVSVVRAIEKISTQKPLIKWVNDIYLGDKKICGILSEAVSDFESGNVESVIVGIGINWNTRAFPAELQQTAASLCDESVSRAALLQAAAQELIKVARDVKNPSIMEDYRAHSMVLGKSVKYFYNGQAFEGKALAIEENGALTVQTDSGIHSLHSGEITLRL